MKIYHLLTTLQRLSLKSGDQINELKLCTAMAKFADVHYNGMRFDPTAPDYGLHEKPIEVPTDSYDLYYVRNNIEVFRQLPSPKVYIAYPYDEEAYRTADAIITTTEIWKEKLENYNDDPEAPAFLNGYYPDKIVLPKRVINIGQTMDPAFVPKTDSFMEFRYKARFGYGFTVAYFGRVDAEAKPQPDYFEVLDELRKEIPSLNTVFSGNIREQIPHASVLMVGKIPYEEMPFAQSACDVLLCNEHEEANWLGSGKTLEAMGCGIPMVLTPRAARVEQLGTEYPLYYRNKAELKDLLLRLYRDQDFYRNAQDYLLERAKYFHIDQHAERLRAQFETLISQS